MERTTAIARRGGGGNDSTNLPDGTRVEVAVVVASATAVLVIVGVSVTVAVAVADAVGVGDGRVGVAVTVGVGVKEGLGVLVGGVVDVRVGEGVCVSVGAGVDVWLGVGVKVSVEVGTAVEEGDGVSVSVGKTVGVAVSTNASAVGVEVTSPVSWSKHPTSPSIRHGTSRITVRRRMKVPPAEVESGIDSDEFKLIRLNCVTGHSHKPRPVSSTGSEVEWAG